MNVANGEPLPKKNQAKASNRNRSLVVVGGEMSTNLVIEESKKLYAKVPKEVLTLSACASMVSSGGSPDTSKRIIQRY